MQIGKNRVRGSGKMNQMKCPVILVINLISRVFLPSASLRHHLYNIHERRQLQRQNHLWRSRHLVDCCSSLLLSVRTNQKPHSDSAAKQILLHLDSMRDGPDKFVIRDGQSALSFLNDTKDSHAHILPQLTKTA